MPKCNCRLCGEEFQNAGYLMFHRKKFPNGSCANGLGLSKEVYPAQQETIITPESEPIKQALIPWTQLPPEIRVLSSGKTVGLRVLGKLTGDGVQIDNVELIR